MTKKSRQPDERNSEEQGGTAIPGELRELLDSQTEAIASRLERFVDERLELLGHPAAPIPSRMSVVLSQLARFRPELYFAILLAILFFFFRPTWKRDSGRQTVESGTPVSARTRPLVEDQAPEAQTPGDIVLRFVEEGEWEEAWTTAASEPALLALWLDRVAAAKTTDTPTANTLRGYGQWVEDGKGVPPFTTREIRSLLLAHAVREGRASSGRTTRRGSEVTATELRTAAKRLEVRGFEALEIHVLESAVIVKYFARVESNES